MNTIDDWFWLAKMHVADWLGSLAAWIAGADHIEFHDYADDGCFYGDNVIYWKSTKGAHDE